MRRVLPAFQKRRNILFWLFFCLTAVLPIFSGAIPHAYAQAVPVPGAADVNRIEPDRVPPLPAQNSNVPRMTSPLKPTQMPEGATTVHLTLENINVKGATVFAPDEIAKIYAPYIGHDITLDVVYDVAAKITQKYRDAGYFLSLAYVPEQEITGGVVDIKVIEGRIDTVVTQGTAQDNHVVHAYINRLTAQVPVKADALESFLLRINDLPGYSYRAVLSPMPDGAEGHVKLTLISSSEKGRGTIGFDNLSSRYLGPNEFSASYEKSLLPLQVTTISGLTSAPAKELRYLTVNHAVTVAPDIQVVVNGNVTRAQPGYTLKPLDVTSNSRDLSAEVQWQYMRQRDHNMTFKFKLERRNTNTEFFNAPFTRDSIRVARATVAFDTADRFNGYTVGQAIVSRGFDAFGASHNNDPDVSRPEAQPSFTKLEVGVSHMQPLVPDFALLASAAGQLASAPLYSSEEFGYGGQSFGRAFDASEITGDSGINGALELQYTGLDTGANLSLTPYVFYDIGKIWNYDAGQVAKASGASAGLGLHGLAMLETSFNIGLAYPLTRDISAPIYGSGENGPRLFLQMNKGF